MIGILCEKPSAARNFAKALGGMKGTYNGESYIIVNALGHLYELCDAHKQVDVNLSNKYKSWDLQYLPWNLDDIKWKRCKKSNVSDVIKNININLSKCDEIIIASDVDPSGEGFLLAAEILDELSLIRSKKITRMIFMDESEKEIQKAFENRVNVPNVFDYPEFKKGYTRSQFDFLTIQFTRIATKLGDGKSVLRNGRLKSAMNLIVGQQLDLIANYKKIPFYEHRFKDENGNVFSDENTIRVPDKTQLDPSLIGKTGTVVVDSRVMKSSAPPKLLDLAGLSSILASRGYKPKDSLACYQKMYEAQIVSYPRTEDKVVTPEQFNELLPKIDKIAEVVGVDSNKLTYRKPRATHVKTGGAHGANRPGLNVPNSLSELKSKYGDLGAEIYEILALNYLSIHAEDYEYEQQKAYIKEYPSFKSTINIAKKLGYKEIFNDSGDIDDDKGFGNIATQFVHEGFPPKPAKPTMKWLMKQLEKYDVGTGATRTSTYSDVTSGKNALFKDVKGNITLTDIGNMNYKLLPNTYIGDLEMTANLQKQMKMVEKGEINPRQILESVHGMVAHDIKVMSENSKIMRKELGISMASEQKEKYTGVYSPTGMGVSFNKKWGAHTFSEEECEKLLKGEQIILSLVSANTGKPYKIKGSLQEQEYKGKTFFGFYNEGFVQEFPESFLGYKFTEKDKEFLQNGEEVFIEGMTSKKSGKEFSAYLTYKDGKFNFRF